MKKNFLFFTFFVFISCNHTTTRENNLQIDTSKNKPTDNSTPRGKIEDWKERGNKLRDTNYLYLDKLLNKVLKIAENHKNDKSYFEIIDTSVYRFKNMDATLQIGNIFSSDKRHLIVKRFINEYDGLQASLFLDIFILEGANFKKLISDTAGIGYSQDTLQDINLDGFKDFIVSQYSGAGCCPRDDKIGYLYNKKNGAFEVVNFFNPNFDNNNKFIYEMDYGHPGEVSIEKYVWRGLSKIKLESISPTLLKDKIFEFVKPYTYTKTIYPSKKTVILKDVPEEYKKLNNFEYFISYQD